MYSALAHWLARPKKAAVVVTVRETRPPAGAAQALPLG